MYLIKVTELAQMRWQSLQSMDGQSEEAYIMCGEIKVPSMSLANGGATFCVWYSVYFSQNHGPGEESARSKALSRHLSVLPQ